MVATVARGGPRKRRRRRADAEGAEPEGEFRDVPVAYRGALARSGTRAPWARAGFLK